MKPDTDILVIGAGMAGLSAAQALKKQGWKIRVVDKGRGVGGRLAGRRIGAATFDHGAQFLTARDPRFLAEVESWREAAVLTEWFRVDEREKKDVVRWRGAPAMTAAAKQWAAGLEVCLQTRITALQQRNGAWEATADDGRSFTARAVVLTAPLPQSLILLESAPVTVQASTRQQLAAIEYESCLAVMAVLEHPSSIPPPGGLTPPAGPLAWIADNQQKGISAEPAVTLHGTPAYSRARWQEPRDDCGRELIDAAQPWLKSAVRSFQVHGWRYSRPTHTYSRRYEILCKDPVLALAGDAFGGPRIEGAVRSGWAAAQGLHPLL